MAPKKKAAAKAEPVPKEEPASKKAKTAPAAPAPVEPAPAAVEPPPPKEEAKEEKADAEMKEEPKEDQNKEKEVDAPDDKRKRITATVGFDSSHTTMNVLPAMDGKVLMSLVDGGMQYLIAGARANVGIKSGRYMFEVKILEALLPFDPSHQRASGRVPTPKQLVQVGFSVAGADLILGDSDGSVCFDSEGYCGMGKKKIMVGTRFGRDQVLGVLLNLDPKSPNKNTVSLFSNGVRVCEPQALPESLVGKTLFPHVSYRNTTLQVHFGKEPMVPLPFKCRTLQDASAVDVQEVKQNVAKDGKYEVLFPVAFPDEGTFDWLDSFLEKNPQYTELSDRKLQEWAVKSGMWKPRAGHSWRHSNDKPDFNFGIPSMDDQSASRGIATIAPLVPRNYVVMEVKQNLVPDDRKDMLKKFSSPMFKKVAYVVMGEPAKDYKDRVLSKLKEQKQAKLNAEFEQKKKDFERKKQVKERQKQLAEVQKKVQEAKKKAEEDKQKETGELAENIEEKQEGGIAETVTKSEDTEMKEEKEDVKKEEEDTKEDVEMMESPAVAELTEEEKATVFLPTTVSDLSSYMLNASFAKFSIPEKAEGFDDIKFVWADEKNSKEYLKSWVAKNKITSRIEDLQPSEWFKTTAAEYEKTCKEWEEKHKAFKASGEKEEKEEKTGEEEGEKPDAEMAEGTKKSSSLDIFSVQDVCDIGEGVPLFEKFAFEDWALLALRWELYLLAAGYKHDVDDAERLGIHESNAAFYYSRYYRKQLNPKLYGKDTIPELVSLVKDTALIDKDTGVLTIQLKEEPAGVSTFVKLQEENRRERQRRIDAGDETARLNFSGLLQQQTLAQKQAQVRANVQDVAAVRAMSSGTPATIMPPPPRGPGNWQPAGKSSWGGRNDNRGRGGRGGGRGRPGWGYAPRTWDSDRQGYGGGQWNQ